MFPSGGTSSKEFRNQVYKILERLKKDGKLKCILRRSFLDECKGERFEQVLLELSSYSLQEKFQNNLSSDPKRNTLEYQTRKFLQLTAERVDYRKKVEQVQNLLETIVKQLEEKKKLVSLDSKPSSKVSKFKVLSDQFFTAISKVKESLGKKKSNLGRGSQGLLLKSPTEIRTEIDVIPEAFFSDWSDWATQRNVSLFFNNTLDLTSLSKLFKLGLSYPCLYLNNRLLDNDKIMQQLISKCIQRESRTDHTFKVSESLRKLMENSDLKTIQELVVYTHFLLNRYTIAVSAMKERISAYGSQLSDTRIYCPFQFKRYQLPVFNLELDDNLIAETNEEIVVTPLKKQQAQSPAVSCSKKKIIMRNPRQILAENIAKIVIQGSNDENNSFDFNVDLEADQSAFASKPKLMFSPLKNSDLFHKTGLLLENEEAPFPE